MAYKAHGSATHQLKPREWNEVKFTEAGSVESDVEFEKLKEAGISGSL
jgi:hypothetical protein